MKSILKKFGFAGIIVLAGAGTALAATAVQVDAKGICGLVEELQGVFKVLRTLAFVGAAFLVAQWAWGYIKSADVKMDEIKDKGTGLLVGFTLLFAIGILISFITSATGLEIIGCDALTEGW